MRERTKAVGDALRIGKIPFANLFPIYHELGGIGPTGGTGPDAPRFEFIEGYPSELNRMLREGALDISPSSSVEYLRDKKGYMYIEGHSISSKGPIRSILLFTKHELDELGGRLVHVTHKSETSVLLLRVVLKRFHGVEARLEPTAAPPLEALAEADAYLAIGDDALLTMHRAGKPGMDDPLSTHSLATIKGERYFVYDLGDLWHRRTGLPFVFALWTLRKETARKRERDVRRFTDALEDAKDRVSNSLGAMAELCPLRAELGTRGLIEYWNGISYGLGTEHMKGLRLFESYARGLGL